MHSVSTSMMVGLWLGGISGCSPVLMNTAESKTADGWTITLSQVKDGPNEYVGEGGILVAPAENQKLVWALLTARNDSGQEQTLDYDTCILGGSGQGFRPLIVDRHADPEVNQPADKAETYDPGQERTRQLVYPFPEDQRPTSLRCGTIALPIPTAK
jgi:hypothetical protein